MNPDNRFLHDVGLEVVEGVDYRVNLPFHRETNRESTMNTLKYLFFHMRCGIFVMIRRRTVVLFVPFANKVTFYALLVSIAERLPFDRKK